MSQNIFLNENKLALHFAQILNISIDDDITMMDIEAELSTIDDLVELRKFIKEKFNYERFRFLTGYQKFLAIVKEFREENKPKLDFETEQRVYNYRTRLLSKITNFSNSLHFEVQAKGYDLKAIKLSETYEKVLNDKDIEICKIIGFRAIYDLAIRNIPKLESELERVITQKALLKQYPQLANQNKKNFDGLETIKKLQGGVR
ncbi:hypothetical protein H0A43_07345 [Arcobacter lanthieri]|uniref:hypothetical protein n=1 Tax=Aliarcobacter lanthieri TaxID=1355374 RepID=UPI0019211630|nr:hypothetical protein [Aliarcobacter lanthieri]MBL3520286.1 hypothetical protein [Aliarcobacter lanthieri]